MAIQLQEFFQHKLREAVGEEPAQTFSKVDPAGAGTGMNPSFQPAGFPAPQVDKNTFTQFSTALSKNPEADETLQGMAKEMDIQAQQTFEQIQDNNQKGEFLKKYMVLAPKWAIEDCAKYTEQVKKLDQTKIELAQAGAKLASGI